MLDKVDILSKKLPDFNIINWNNYDDVEIGCKVCGNIKSIQIWNVVERNSKIICNVCSTKKEIIELNNILTTKSSFTAISYESLDRILLNCTLCGSQIRRSKQNCTVNKTVPCEQCERNKVISNIPKNKILISYEGIDNIKLQCTICDTQQTVSKYQILQNAPKVMECETCNTDKLRQCDSVKNKWHVIDNIIGKGVLLECITCGSSYTTPGSSITNNTMSRCRTCVLTERNTMISKVDATPIDISDFDNIICKCNNCNYIFTRKYTNIKKGYGCPICTSVGMSRGEQLIAKYLHSKNIEFITEYKLPGVYKYMDFYLPLYDTFIEFDGEQHFKFVKLYGIDNFIKTQFSDLYKNEYCRNHKKNLIRISSSEQGNIETILENNIAKKGLNFIGKEYENTQTFLNYINMKSSDISIIRDDILTVNNGKCIVTNIKTDEPYSYHLDHKHKDNKSGIIGDEYQGLVRGTLEAGCNMLLGKIENNFHRVGLANLGIDLPDYLEKLAAYLRNDPYYNLVDGKLSVYIHPTELPKAPILQKDSYGKLLKELKKINYPNKIPEYPKSGNMTQPLQKLYEMVNIIPEYYKK